MRFRGNQMLFISVVNTYNTCVAFWLNGLCQVDFSQFNSFFKQKQNVARYLLCIDNLTYSFDK